MEKEMSFRVPFEDMVRRIVEYSREAASLYTVDEITAEIMAPGFEWGFKSKDYEMHLKEHPL